MILLCGIPTEPPMAMVTEALEKLGAPFRVFNQRHYADTHLVVDSAAATTTAGAASEVRRLADEDQIVGTRKVFTEQAQFAQAVGRHEVGVVNDGHEHFAGAVDAEGLLDQQAFAVVVAAAGGVFDARAPKP